MSLYEIRLDDDGTIDEIVAPAASVHIERMDTNDFAITLHLPDEHELMCAAHTKRARVDVTAYYDGPEPPPSSETFDALPITSEET